MKKVTFIMALAAAAGLASCTAQSPKANLKTDVDSLSYAIGMARTEGLDQYLAQQGIDSTQMTDFLKGFNEGASKIDKKDVAYMAGLQIGQMVSKQWVNYTGTLIDGTEFDSSYKRKEPATFRANQVIKGWTEALTMMPVGSKWELYIPQELAYGARETGGPIKPFSTLIFEVELVGIEK